MPERLNYRLKNKLLGPPLVRDDMRSERLSNGVALGVLSPDCISSSAYGPEQILRVLVPVVGAGAFTLVMPVTGAILLVLFLVTMSYREVVMVYTKAGGSYAVSRDNFGVRIAQVAAVALLIDYVVTVAVQTSAGADALISAFDALGPYKLEYHRRRGRAAHIRESPRDTGGGRAFAAPTYLFIVTLGLVIVIGLTRKATGNLPVLPINVPGAVPPGPSTNGFLMGASVFILLRAFANGGSSLTGLEAISNGVSAFQPPEGRNARRVLVVMSLVLGTLVAGVSLLAPFTHATPYVSGFPTVISQEAQQVFGHSGVGNSMYYVFQAATMLILFTGANTSFNGFPFLASFVAEDSFLPRQLTRRGHRLVFSKGIVALSIVAIAILLATDASVNRLVSVYAIGVFTGFTMAGSGMVRHHLRTREPHWRRKVVINGSAAVLSFSVVLIFAITKFTEGAWIVVVLFPLLVWGLIRLNREYREEAATLRDELPGTLKVRPLRRHVVLVLVQDLDLAANRALQYAKSLGAASVRAVHFMIDEEVAERLEDAWTKLDRAGIPLEVIDVPDRRVVRAALDLAAEVTADGETEVSILLPRPTYPRFSGRVLHDRVADRVAAAISALPHATATIVPFQLGRPLVQVEKLAPAGEGPAAGGGVTPAPRRPETAAAAAAAAERGGARRRRRRRRRRRQAGAATEGAPGSAPLRPGRRVRVQGKLKSVTVRPVEGVPVVECALAQGDSVVVLRFMGRRRVIGIHPGVTIKAGGTVRSDPDNRLVIDNPSYTLLDTGPDSEDEQ